MAQDRGVIDDPDGFVNVRSGRSTSSAVVTKVKDGEPFTFEPHADSPEWAKVILRSGKSGWMHRSRIRLHFTADDLSKDERLANAETELATFGRTRGVDYFAVTRRAARGQGDALKQFLDFAEDIDGGAGEGYYYDLIVLAHLIGDEKLSIFLRGQTKSFRRRAVESFNCAWELTGLADAAYFQRCFPKSAAALRE